MTTDPKNRNNKVQVSTIGGSGEARYALAPLGGEKMKANLFFYNIWVKG
jgi:hypothetical protein